MRVAVLAIAIALLVAPGAHGAALVELKPVDSSRVSGTMLFRDQGLDVLMLNNKNPELNRVRARVAMTAGACGQPAGRSVSTPARRLRRGGRIMLDLSDPPPRAQALRVLAGAKLVACGDIERLVAFEEGDPDQPIIVGSVLSPKGRKGVNGLVIAREVSGGVSVKAIIAPKDLTSGQARTAAETIHIESIVLGRLGGATTPAVFRGCSGPRGVLACNALTGSDGGVADLEELTVKGAGGRTIATGSALKFTAAG